MLFDFDWSQFAPQVDPNLSAQQITTMGYNTLWERGMFCPNRITSKNNHNLNCTLCDLGYIYDSGEAQKAVVTSISLRQQYESAGRFDAGMSMITMLPGVKLSWWDRLTLTESILRYTEPFTPPTPPSLVTHLRYAVVDSDAFRGVVRLMGQSGTDYILDTDYSIQSDGSLLWVATPTEAFYSVSYFIRPRYVILDMNHVARSLPSFGPGAIQPSGVQTTQEFPVMAVGKLDFLIGDESTRVAD